LSITSAAVIVTLLPLLTPSDFILLKGKGAKPILDDELCELKPLPASNAMVLDTKAEPMEQAAIAAAISELQTPKKKNKKTKTHPKTTGKRILREKQFRGNVRETKMGEFVHSEIQIRAEFELQFAERNAKDNCAEKLFMNERPWSVRAREAGVPANGR
jgi:hypothetical protein